jgi:hypothetical protein
MKKLGKIKDLLSREEMKQIQGGSGACGGWMTQCNTYVDCCDGYYCEFGAGSTWGRCTI